MEIKAIQPARIGVNQLPNQPAFSIRVEEDLVSSIGERFGEIAVETNNPRFPRLSIPVTVISRSAFDFEPRFLLFRPGSDNEKPGTRSLHIKAPRPVALKPRSEGIRLSCVMPSQEPTTDWEFVCQYEPAQVQEKNGFVELDVVGDPHENSLRVPYAYVRR